MKNGIDRVLRNGREIHYNEIDIAETARTDDLCEINTEKYVHCANPEDDDYNRLRRKECKGEIIVDDTNNICNKCGRLIPDIQSKQKFSRKIIDINEGRVRDEIREIIKSETSYSWHTVSRSYYGHTFEYVLSSDSIDPLIFILFDNIGRELVEWIKIYDEKPILVLVGDAVALEKQASEYSIPVINFGDIYTECNISVETVLSRSDKDLLADREIKASLSLKKTSSDPVIRKMKYDEFEHCVQNLLLGTIGNSNLIGSTEAGSGVPDGVLALCRDKADPQLFMWDAKFVDFTKSDKDKTHLRDEYDKIFRHLSTLENFPGLEPNFDQIKGIILFSPGIKESNVTRLAEFIEENNFMRDNEWNGTICYFKYDALTHLYELYRDNRSGVRQKENVFRMILSKFISSPSIHDDDPDSIQNATAKCLELSKSDVKRIFDKLEGFSAEESQFPVEEYMSYLEIVAE